MEIYICYIINFFQNRVADKNKDYIFSFWQNKFNARKEAIEDEMKKEASQIKKDAFEDVFEDTRCGRYQRFLWDLMEKPHTSLAAKVISR